MTATVMVEVVIEVGVAEITIIDDWLALNVRVLPAKRAQLNQSTISPGNSNVTTRPIWARNKVVPTESMKSDSIRNKTDAPYPTVHRDEAQLA